MIYSLLNERLIGPQNRKNVLLAMTLLDFTHFQKNQLAKIGSDPGIDSLDIANICKVMFFRGYGSIEMMLYDLLNFKRREFLIKQSPPTKSRILADTSSQTCSKTKLQPLRRFRISLHSQSTPSTKIFSSLWSGKWAQDIFPSKSFYTTWQSCIPTANPV